MRMAFHTTHGTTSGRSSLRPFLQTARFIYSEGDDNDDDQAQLFHTFILLKFYRGFPISLVGIVPYAGTGFVTWDYLPTATTLVPVSVSLDGCHLRTTPLTDLSIGTLRCSGADSLVSARGHAPAHANWRATAVGVLACSLSVDSYFPWCSVQFRKVRQGL
jgi:hypothetical protein